MVFLHVFKFLICVVRLNKQSNINYVNLLTSSLKLLAFRLLANMIVKGTFCAVKYK